MSDKLRDTMRMGFVTCNSPGDGSGNVKIEFSHLENAQELHRLIVGELVTPEPPALISEVAEKIVGCIRLPKTIDVVTIIDVLTDFKRAIELASGPKVDYVNKWIHSCNTMCANVELWIPRCPHCGMPSPNEPPKVEDAELARQIEEARGLTEGDIEAVDQTVDRWNEDFVARQLTKPTQSGEATCPECKGAGIVSSYSGTELTARDCPRCTQSGEPIHDWAWAQERMRIGRVVNREGEDAESGIRFNGLEIITVTGEPAFLTDEDKAATDWATRPGQCGG